MRKIIHTIFYTGLYSYFLFFFIDYLRPGFVSFHFSVHILLLFTFLLGIAVIRIRQDSVELQRSQRMQLFGFLVVSICLGLVFWREGEVFGDFRLFMTVAPFFLAVLSWYSMNDETYD